MAENYLRTLAEPVPGWIEDFREGEPFPRNAFFGSRVVYYPGAGDDGSAVRLFNSTHSCHCFVYVDYAVGQAKVEGSIGDPVRRFRGSRYRRSTFASSISRQRKSPPRWSD